MYKRKGKVLLALVMTVILAAGMLSGCTNSAKAAAGSSVVVNASESVIDENNIMGIIQELTSKKYDGRKAGTEGNQLAAGYIADYFKKIGLENPKGLENYMQYYEQPLVDLKTLPELSIVDKDGKTAASFKYVENFTLRALSSSTKDIAIKAPIYVLKSLSDLSDSNKELKGKMLLVSYELRGQTNNDSLIDMAYRSGAVGVIAEYDTKGPYRSSGTQTITPLIGAWLRKDYNPFMNIDSDSFTKLEDAASKDMLVQFSCSFNTELQKKVANVLGLLPGSDEKLKDEYIIIGSHFDHVGDNLDGTYNPGALDNASGTAAMMEIARVLKENKIQPKKSILFMSFNGEEAGMMGSGYYAAHPVYPLKKAVMINLDMVGSSEKMPLSIDTANGIKLRKELESYAEKIGLDTTPTNEGRSDHESFANMGVPAVTLINDDFFNGYHSPADNMEDVSKDRIEQIVKLVLYYIDKNAY